jgi:hypothetical protein
MARLADRRADQARPEGDAERRQLHADPLPDREEAFGGQADDYLTARGYVLRRVAAYGFPNALRMTIGTEEANRGVIAALAEFLKS